MSAYNTDMIHLEVDTWLDTKFGRKKVKLCSLMLSRSRKRNEAKFPQLFVSSHDVAWILAYQQIEFSPPPLQEARDLAKNYLEYKFKLLKRGETTIQGKFLLSKHVFLFRYKLFCIFFLLNSQAF